VNLRAVPFALLAATTVAIFSAKPASAARSGSAPDPNSTVIVIDAGHGGFDRGGIPRQRIAEKDMTLDVALRLRSILQKSGYRVVMTRDRDVFVSLPGRIGLANSYRNAIFVCIHFNSATRSGANGIETYFYGRDSLALASAIHYNVVGSTPTPNRGVRRRGYYVLRKARVPAVLVECGFLTNPTEGSYALKSGYRQTLAESIARGIRNRSAVAGRSSSGQLVAEGTIPLQPFIDQTRVRESYSKKKRSRKTTKRRSSKSALTGSKSGLASSKSKSHHPED
jgi:N-acetylmuramoyl-L-alanine amidase